MNDLTAIVAMVGIIGLVIFGVVAVLKGLRPQLKSERGKFSIKTK